MDRFKAWIHTAIVIIVWITVMSYTISMVATVESAVRQVGYNGTKSTGA